MHKRATTIARPIGAARCVVLINSDQPASHANCFPRMPQNGGVVFKLSCDEDRDIVSEKFCIEPATSYFSFTFTAAFPQTIRSPSAIPHRMPCSACSARRNTSGLASTSLGGAFTCALQAAGEPLSACFIFKNHWNCVGNR